MDLTTRVKRELSRVSEQSDELQERWRHYNEQREKIAHRSTPGEGYKIPLMRRIGHGTPPPPRKSQKF
jgi:hypothetical protein